MASYTSPIPIIKDGGDGCSRFSIQGFHEILSRSGAGGACERDRHDARQPLQPQHDTGARLCSPAFAAGRNRPDAQRRAPAHHRLSQARRRGQAGHERRGKPRLGATRSCGQGWSREAASCVRRKSRASAAPEGAKGARPFAARPRHRQSAGARAASRCHRLDRRRFEHGERRWRLRCRSMAISGTSAAKTLPRRSSRGAMAVCGSGLQPSDRTATPRGVDSRHERTGRASRRRFPHVRTTPDERQPPFGGCKSSTHSTVSGLDSTFGRSRLTTTGSWPLRTSTQDNGASSLALISWCGTKGGT